MFSSCHHQREKSPFLISAHLFCSQRSVGINSLNKLDGLALSARLFSGPSLHPFGCYVCFLRNRFLDCYERDLSPQRMFFSGLDYAVLSTLWTMAI
ncbi:hypothetical protein K1719_025939 [Acacia pycnantha]|nr:hypothetical protein K1719_025939 [Acacia pycnantha]